MPDDRLECGPVVPPDYAQIPRQMPSVLAYDRLQVDSAPPALNQRPPVRRVLLFGVNGEVSGPLTAFYHSKGITVEHTEAATLDDARRELRQRTCDILVVGEGKGRDGYAAGEVASYLHVTAILFGRGIDHRQVQLTFNGRVAHNDQTLCQRIREIEQWRGT